MNDDDLLSARFHGPQNEITIKKPFVQWLGSIESAMVLDQFFRWQCDAGNEWWNKTDEEIRALLLISQHAVARARDTLEGLGLLRRERRGLPAKMYYLLDTGAVQAGLIAFLRHTEGGTTA